MQANYFILPIYKYTRKSVFDKWKDIINIDERDIIIEFSLLYKDIIYFMLFAIYKNYPQTHFVALINQHVYDTDSSFWPSLYYILHIHSSLLKYYKISTKHITAIFFLFHNLTWLCIAFQFEMKQCFIL